MKIERIVSRPVFYAGSLDKLNESFPEGLKFSNTSTLFYARGGFRGKLDAELMDEILSDIATQGYDGLVDATITPINLIVIGITPNLI